MRHYILTGLLHDSEKYEVLCGPEVSVVEQKEQYRKFAEARGVHEKYKRVELFELVPTKILKLRTQAEIDRREKEFAEAKAKAESEVKKKAKAEKKSSARKAEQPETKIESPQ